jgi:hypothetical protein
MPGLRILGYEYLRIISENTQFKSLLVLSSPVQKHNVVNY